MTNEIEPVRMEIEIIMKGRGTIIARKAQIIPELSTDTDSEVFLFGTKLLAREIKAMMQTIEPAPPLTREQPAPFETRDK